MKLKNLAINFSIYSIFIVAVFSFTGCMSPLIPENTFRYEVRTKINGSDYNLSREFTASLSSNEWRLMADVGIGPSWLSDAYEGFNGITLSGDMFAIQPSDDHLNEILFDPERRDLLFEERYKGPFYDSRIFMEANNSKSLGVYYEEFNSFATKSKHNQASIEMSKISLIKEDTKSYFTYKKDEKFPLKQHNRITVWKREFNRKYIHNDLNLRVLIKEKTIPWIDESNEYKLYESKYKNHLTNRAYRYSPRLDRLQAKFYKRVSDPLYIQLYYNGEYWENNDDENVVIYWVDKIKNLIL